jgi:hypothetical protein
MILKTVFATAVCGVLLASSTLSSADEYRPGEYLGLDLSRALLSPKPLGPPVEFAPLSVQAMSDSRSEAIPASVELKAGPKIATPRIRLTRRDAQVSVAPKIAIRTTRLARRGGAAQASLAAEVALKSASRQAGMAHAGGVRPRSAARRFAARSHGNPLDAEAFDTRVQVWPCKSGGICDWKR